MTDASVAAAIKLYKKREKAINSIKPERKKIIIIFLFTL